MLLATFIVFGIILIGSGTLSAVDVNGTNQTPSMVTVDPADKSAGQDVNLRANVTANGTSVNGGSVKFTVNSVNAGNATVSNGSATLNWKIPSNWIAGHYTITADFDGTGTNYTNSTNTSTLNVPMKAYWMRFDDVADPSTLKNQGITDIFFLTRGANGKYHHDRLQWAINTYKLQHGINVHSWVTCFKDNNQFVNPSGYYSYTKQIYVRTIRKWGRKAVPFYRKVRDGKYKVGKRWKWKYRYVTRYRYKRGWIYTPVYRYETVSGYDTSYRDRLVNSISDIASKYNVDGIHFDYVRYSGNTRKGLAAWQQPGGTEAAVNTITGFVEAVSKKVKADKPAMKLSAAVMPEGRPNRDAYAQDYDRLADFLDFLTPMIYEGNYRANNGWIKSATEYIVNNAKKANGTKIPVYAGLTTYVSDWDLRALSHYELQADVNSAKAGGASGFALFRFGYGCSAVPLWT